MCKFATQKNKMDMFDHSPIFIFQVFATFRLGVKYAVGRRNEDRSVVLRARIGQRCDFRTLKNNIDKLEAIIGLRSGGLPVPHRKKIFEDRIDLMVAMQDILYTFFAANPNATDETLHQTFVLGPQS